MRRIARTALAVATVLLAGFSTAACEDDSAQATETKAKEKGYDKLVASQPIEVPEYSTTRETINRWIKTWGKAGSKGKLSYVYLQNAKGEYGYFVLKGLPVSYCALGTPPSKTKSSTNGMVNVPLPEMDGTYSKGAGACNTYYGFDATTGAYLEFTIGMNQSFFLFDQPSTLPEFSSASQMGPSSIEDVDR
jgi:predicted small secreted protein